MHRQVPSPCCFFAIAVLAVLLCPSVGALKHSRAASMRNTKPETITPFFKEVGVADLPFKEIPIFPSGKVPEEYLGEMAILWRTDQPDPPGSEKKTSYPEKEQRFLDVLQDCHIHFHPGNRTTETVFNVNTPILEPLILKPYLPHRTGAAVIIAPGGGNKFLAWDGEGHAQALGLLKLGINVFVLKYRVPSDGTRLPLIDAQRAVSLVRYHALDMGLDPSKIGFMGSSAGGYLTTELSTSTVRHYYRIDNADDVSYLPDFAVVAYGGAPLIKDWEILIGLIPRQIPTFMVHAKDDPCVSVESSQLYCDAMLANGQICDRHVYEHGGHGYQMCLGDVYPQPGFQFVNADWTTDEVCAWPADLERFLRTYVFEEQLAPDAKLILPDYLEKVRRGTPLDPKGIATEDWAYYAMDLLRYVDQ